MYAVALPLDVHRRIRGRARHARLAHDEVEARERARLEDRVRAPRVGYIQVAGHNVITEGRQLAHHLQPKRCGKGGEGKELRTN